MAAAADHIISLNSLLRLEKCGGGATNILQMSRVQVVEGRWLVNGGRGRESRCKAAIGYIQPAVGWTTRRPDTA
jgi:hypothetical protein